MKLHWNLYDLRKADAMSVPGHAPRGIHESRHQVQLSDTARMQLHNCHLSGMVISDWQGSAGDRGRFEVTAGEASGTVISMNFMLEGDMQSDFHAFGKAFHIGRNQHNLLFSPRPEGEHTFRKGVSRALNVSFDPSYFTQLVDFDEAPTAALLERMTRGDAFLASREMMPVQPRMLGIIGEMRDCPLKGGFKKMYLEGKVLELLSLQLEQSCRPVPAPSALRKPDLDRIRQVREYLDDQYVHPASLPEIGRMFGLNEFKLKKGFRELYGTTVFGYALERRMELARKLLGDGVMNVNQVADAVGYENPNHFSAAFKKRFGYSPGVVLRRLG